MLSVNRCVTRRLIKKNMFKLTKLLFLSIVSSAIFGLNNTALAAAESCLNNNNLICITETYDAEQSEDRGDLISRYGITNNSETQVFAFAVTNASGGGLQAYLGEDFLGWDSKTIGVDSWDITQTAINFSHPSISPNWATGGDINGLTTIGGFNELFGETTDTNNNPLYANLYWNSSSENALTTGVTLDEFLFYGLPESNFVAFDQNGSVIASSLTSPVAAVPEPSQYALLMAGLCVLSFFRKQKLYQL